GTFAYLHPTKATFHGKSGLVVDADVVDGLDRRGDDPFVAVLRAQDVSRERGFDESACCSGEFSVCGCQ
ncbi:hypothetical protein ACWDTP_06470, partial [Mycobacterium sp. NPDC003449]